METPEKPQDGKGGRRLLSLSFSGEGRPLTVEALPPRGGFTWLPKQRTSGSWPARAQGPGSSQRSPPVTSDSPRLAPQPLSARGVAPGPPADTRTASAQAPDAKRWDGVHSQPSAAQSPVPPGFGRVGRHEAQGRQGHEGQPSVRPSVSPLARGSAPSWGRAGCVPAPEGGSGGHWTLVREFRLCHGRGQLPT